eukprot:2126733-Pyramimonas_sp.AAC.1
MTRPSTSLPTSHDASASSPPGAMHLLERQPSAIMSQSATYARAPEVQQCHVESLELSSGDHLPGPCQEAPLRTSVPTGGQRRASSQ